MRRISARASARRGQPTVRPLVSVLREAGRPLSMPELYALANYDRDSTEHVERFYLAIRAELGKTIVVVSSDSENATLEAPGAP